MPHVPPDGLLALSLGCRSGKQAGTIGVDMIPGEGVDLVVDLRDAQLPFPDDSVGHVFSSHAFEHLPLPFLLTREIPRVCADRAGFEFWLPYSWHGDAHALGHRSYWNEEAFLHMSRRFRDHWRLKTGANWNLTSLVYVVDPSAEAAWTAAGMTPAFAIRHLINVVSEFGVIGHIDKPGRDGDPPPPIEVTFALGRDPAQRRPLLVDGTAWW